MSDPPPNSTDGSTPPFPGSTASVHLETWKQSAEAIGRVCMAFQSLEDSLTAAISYLLNSAYPEIGRLVAAQMPFKVKIDVFFALFDYSCVDDHKRDELTTILKSCFKAEANRNALIHSSWSRSFAEPEMVLRQKRSAKFRRGYKLTSEEMFPEDIKEIENRLHDCSSDVLDFMQKSYLDFSSAHFAMHLESNKEE